MAQFAIDFEVARVNAGGDEISRHCGWDLRWEEPVRLTQYVKDFCLDFAKVRYCVKAYPARCKMTSEFVSQRLD
jgi:hypothetical protein